jgi:hypothetical protein
MLSPQTGSSQDGEKASIHVRPTQYIQDLPVLENWLPHSEYRSFLVLTGNSGIFAGQMGCRAKFVPGGI